MSILLPSPRSNQPDYPVLVDSSNSIAKELIVSLPMNQAGCVVDASQKRRNSNVLASSNITWGTGQNGTQLNFNGSQASGDVSWGDVPWFDNFSGSLSFEIDYIATSITNAPVLFSKWGATAAAQSVVFLTRSTGAIEITFYLGAGVYHQWISVASAAPVNTRIHLVFVWVSSNTAFLHINGKPVSFSSTPAGTSRGILDSTDPFQLGNWSETTTRKLAGSIGMVNIWGRSLSNAEAYLRYINRWSLFAPVRAPISVTVSSITYTYARPTSDITTQWSTSSGSTHYTLIDETVADDNDYIVATAAGQTDEVKLASMTPPQVGTNLVINYKVTGVDGGATVTVSLRQGSGGTLIKTDTAKNANGTYALAVAPGDWAAVTDWSDLRLRFVSA